MAIDKITAGILYSYNYKLKDSEGKIFGIHLITENTLGIYGSKVNDDKYIKYSEIGTTYKILARPLEMLTKEIEGKVPLIELAKVLKPSWDWELEDARGERRAYSKIASLLFYFECDEDGFTLYENRDGHSAVLKQPALFDKLKEYHFNIGFPEGTTTNLI